MATLFLQTAGGMLGGALGGSTGAMLGRAAGSLLSQSLGSSLSGSARAIEGPRLETLIGLTSNEGAPVPRVYGRVRIGGQVIWATRFIETSVVTRSGGSGGKASQPRGTKTTTYAYAANFAVGLCEGEIAFVRRIWADGREIDRAGLSIRIYRGTMDQSADPLIVAKEGAADAPAYRGLAYAVFENFPLGDYGNRIPQLFFEIVRPVNGLCAKVRAVNLIPGSTEYAYSVAPLMQSADGTSVTENRHQVFGDSDWQASLDALQALCPNLQHVALVVSWFGDDMRAGACHFAPRVERRDKSVVGAEWSVAGVTRASAQESSKVNGKPAYGGTPSDATARAALVDLKSRGLSVLFYPFVMMDVPFGNLLPDPATGAPGQTAYGWRGEIQPAAPDGTADVRAEMGLLFASYRRFILHYAQLCAGAGVESFLLGSELRGLTRARDETGAYPAVAALCALAADVRAVLGPNVRLSYGADWTEYGAYVRESAREVSFPLDPLWASANIDFIGIDCYAPLSDWRNGPAHLDAALARSPHDLAYLRSNVAGGEGFDFYYADDAGRAAQLRLPIEDGAYGKPWMYRAKDFANWWSQPHVGRKAGREIAGQTAWVPCSKPIRFIEFGCPAVDLGANAPNVFPDDKVAAQNLPPFSAGTRDDLMQLRANEAFLDHFNSSAEGFDETDNPVSPLYGARMVDVSHIYLWAWDARPFPAFPMLAGVWSDAANWDTGHWLNGRLESADLSSLVPLLIDELSGESVASADIDCLVEGYVVDRPMSARAAVEPLMNFFCFDAAAGAGGLVFQARPHGVVVEIGEDDLAPLPDGALVRLTRAEDSGLPREIALAYTESEWDYRPALTLSRRLEGATKRVGEAELAIVTHGAAAQCAGDVLLHDLWVARETAVARLRPGLRALEVGDLVRLPVTSGPRLFQITRLTDDALLEIEARAVDEQAPPHRPRLSQRAKRKAPLLPGPPRIEILDLAVTRSDPPVLQYVAAFADPWPGALAIWRSADGETFDYAGEMTQCAILGETLDDLAPGPVGRFDMAAQVRLRLRAGALSSASDKDVLAGRNLIALRGADGAWEIVGFAKAEILADGVWRVSRLLRGQAGSESLAVRLLPRGARVVLLDDSVVALASGVAALGLRQIYRIGPAARDYADPAYVQLVATPGSSALLPWSPVRAQARRNAQGVEISFIRRTRRDGDNWDVQDVPLGEESESYAIDILQNGRVIRTLTSTTTKVLYPAAVESADFGAAQTRLALRIAQVSALAGRGFPLEAQISVS